jgi:ubiquinone/menaquinone biosynthesis C-methylase UbiE
MMLVEHWSYILYQRDCVIPKYDLKGSVLEIGCGRRGWFSLITKSYFDSFVCTTDISSEKVHKAKEIARALGILSDCYVVADATRLPFINGVFDKVIGNAVLHHVLENIEGAAKEIFRITKEDGMGIFTGEIVSSRFIGWLWKKLVLNKIPGEGIATKDAWKKAFRNSGFNNVNVLRENRYGYNPSNMRNFYYQVIRHLPEEIVTRYLITSVTIIFNKRPTGKILVPLINIF